MPVSTTPITGYPNFAALKDKPTADQLKLVWDCLIAISADLARVAAATPDATATTITAQIADIQARLTAGGL